MRGVRSWGSEDDERLQVSCECVECEGRDASRSCTCPWWCSCSGSSRETYEEDISVVRGERRTNRTMSGRTLDEEYGQEGTEPEISGQFVRPGPSQHTHTMSPVQSPMLDIFLTR